MRRMIPWAGVVACCAAVGCGPMTGPMPQRMPDEKQKEIDDAWNDALAPVDKHGRQAWLDAMIVTYAYQIGVDELTFHSVKKWEGGTVVMDIRTARDRPEDDHFTVTVLEKAGKELRKERYARGEVEEAGRAFERNREHPERMTPEEKAAIEARGKRAAAMFPRSMREKDEPGEK